MLFSGRHELETALKVNVRTVLRIGATVLGVLLFISPVYLVPILVIFLVEFPHTGIPMELIDAVLIVCGLALWYAAARLLLYGYLPGPIRHVFIGWFR